MASMVCFVCWCSAPCVCGIVSSCLPLLVNKWSRHLSTFSWPLVRSYKSTTNLSSVANILSVIDCDALDNAKKALATYPHQVSMCPMLFSSTECWHCVTTGTTVKCWQCFGLVFTQYSMHVQKCTCMISLYQMQSTILSNVAALPMILLWQQNMCQLYESKFWREKWILQFCY
jgi:hypothetical protein